MVQDVRDHAGRGRLAVGAGRGHRPAFAEHRIAQPLRAGGVGHVVLQDVFHGLVAAGHVGVADDGEVGPWAELGGLEAFEHFDARVGKLVAHGRIESAVEAADDEPLLLRELRQATHEGATDAEEIEPLGLAQVRWSKLRIHRG